MVKHDIAYVLVSVITGKVEMATGNDSEAWAFYRDMRDIRILVFVDGNQIASAEPLKTSI
ncbi:hypothetical protein [Paenibacillus terrae]|uniref:Uncharacterized protein n=1 Tax=Paenibacillus terrae TaxID=159743 RepID=A0A0D7WW17_9BACL|nr:hypothetical protein [Paenibacillus terrae]KJD43381.1 hypothetical protein QD47_23035 [Paenibacillus terrae]